ncbi:hypothetical protein C7D74_33120, partial [Klebsiella pneumoniae]
DYSGRTCRLRRRSYRAHALDRRESARLPAQRRQAGRSSSRPIFVNAMDTNPLAAEPQPIILAERAAFDAGLTV